MSKVRFSIAREALLPALALAGKAVERRSTIPVLQNMLFAVQAGRLRVTGTDLDCDISASAECKAETEASFTLPAGTVHDAVRKLAEGVEITFEVEKDFATISAGRSRFRVPVLPSGDFPEIAQSGFTHHFALPSAALTRMLATVSYAISSEETRYYLNGIYWHASGDEGGGEHFNAVATDGHRMARFRAPLPAGAEDMPGIIVPRRTVGLLKALLADKGDVAISLSDTKIMFTTPAGSLISKLIDGTYPDYARVIPQGNPNQFGVDKKTLADAVDRVITITSERGSAVKFKFSADDGLLKLDTVNPEAGSASEETSVSPIAGQGVEIGFNGRYCLDMLNAAEGDELVFNLGDAGAPALIEPAIADEHGLKPLFVIMPMRV